MIFNLLYPVASQTVFRLPLDKSVHEVHTLTAPAIRRDLVELDLLCQNFFTDFLTIGTYVGSLNQ